jgi:hypothetical protein
MNSKFNFGILVIVSPFLVSFASLGQTQTFQSFTWASNGVSNIVVPSAEVWEIITWGTKTSSANGLNTLYSVPGGLTLSYTTNVFYTKLNKADTDNPCGTVLVGPTTITRIANAKVSDYLLVIQKLSTNNTTNNTTNSTVK